ncbi:restriction endonuclease subunit S [Tessaracoccus massiliensis]|uniref:restriction endonuclease subunit S n=1 Tax=Tessaracoccus massiliensis TaxID=1522311 RepID=UPI000941D200|nr:restriction endonuclease subunit S [Tessaracoccus massiliensis]
MSSLPSGWSVRTLGEIADTALGKMLDRGRSKGLPQVRYLRNINVQWGRIDTGHLAEMELADEERERFRVREGDLLVCEGGEVGRAAIWKQDDEYIAYQKALHRVRPKDGIAPEYLRYALENAARTGALKPFTTGSTIAHLPQQNLRRLPIALAPQREQPMVIEALEGHLSRIQYAHEALERGMHRLDAVTKAILVGLIPDRDGYPKDWITATVGDAGRVELGRQRHPDCHSGPNMRPYLRVANVFEDRIDSSDLMEMHWPGDSFERFELRPGDILLNEGQSPQFLGRPALYAGEPANVAFTNSLIRFRARADVLPEFALLVFRRHMHAGRFMRESRITTNIAHLSASRLKRVEFPIPPVSAQEKIVAAATDQLSCVARLRTSVTGAKRREGLLRRSLLSAAFSGRLTRRASDIDHLEEFETELEGLAG